MLLVLLIQAAQHPQGYRVGDDWDVESSVAGFSERASSRGGATFDTAQPQNLKDIVQLRRHFKAGSLCINEKNCDELTSALVLYSSAFNNYNYGVTVEEQVDSEKLLALLYVFTNIKQLKINVQFTDGKTTASIIASSVQFYKMLGELNIANCGLTDDNMQEIVDSLLSAAEDAPPALKILDIRNNNISPEFIAEMRQHFPQLINSMIGKPLV